MPSASRSALFDFAHRAASERIRVSRGAAEDRGPSTYQASRPHAEDSATSSGLYYLGESQAVMHYAVFLRGAAWPAAGRRPAFRSIAPDLAAFDREMTTQYETMPRANHPPAAEPCHIRALPFVIMVTKQNDECVRRTPMKPRMNHPVMVLPAAMNALQALHQASEGAGLPESTIQLVQVRASQINGCGPCLDIHAHQLKRAGESDERIFAVAAWRDTPYFSDAERAALALAESLTRLSDRPDAVPDEIWAEAARHYDERALAALLLAIAGINVWNRLNVAIRQTTSTAAREAVLARA